MKHYWLGFLVDDRNWIPYQRVIYYHPHQLAPTLMYPPLPRMIHPLGYQFFLTIPLLPHALVVAPIVGPPPEFGPIPTHAPLALMIIALHPPRVIVLAFYTTTSFRAASGCSCSSFIGSSTDPEEVPMTTDEDVVVSVVVDADDQMAADDEDPLAVEDEPVEDP